jgi:hypothetical protein
MSFETVDKLNRDFENYYNNGQIKEAINTYANDARLFATDKQVYQGLNQIEKYYSLAQDAGNTKVNLHTGEVIQCGPDYLIEIRLLSKLTFFFKVTFFFHLALINSIQIVEIMLSFGKKMGDNGKK